MAADDDKAECMDPVTPDASGRLGGRRTRLWSVTALVLAILIIGTTLVGSRTHWFGLRPDERQAVAIDHCEAAVRRELTAPAQAQFGAVDARADIVTEDDHIRLGFDASNVVAMWGVSGSVQSPGRSGQMAKLEFDCRAAFFDGGQVRTSLNYGSADLPGQLASHR